MLHGLPAGYHRELQEDKEPLFDTVDTLDLVLPAITGAVTTVRFDVAAMRDACAAEGLYATDLAEALVKTGVPFREAHRRTGALLKELAGRDGTLTSMTDKEWDAFGVPGGRALLDPDASVAAHATPGGPSAQSVRAQVDALEALLAGR
jgi:argininosuccinate lyase